MNISLIYLNFPFWRAEVARISLSLGNIKFEDKRINSEEFQRVKKHGKLDDGTIIPFHQLPCLIANNISISQTGGIARFCGKLSNLYPKKDAILASQIDQFIDILTDITVIISSTKPKLRNDAFISAIDRKLYILNKSIDGDQDYLVKNYFSIADIAIWNFMCWLTGGKIEAVPVDIAKSYCNIIKICRLIDKKTGIQKWVNKTFPKEYIRNFY